MKQLISLTRFLFLTSVFSFLLSCQTSFQSMVDAFDNPDQFKTLLDGLSDINITDSYGRTLLMSAAESNSKEIAAILIDRNIDVGLTDLGARNALDYAIFNNSLDTFILILEKSPKLSNDRNTLEGILLNAMELNKVDFVNFLLHKRFPINATLGRTNRTLLNSAIEFSHQNKDVIRLLVKKGADVNFMESDGKSPLFRLRQNSDIECLKAIIDGGANLNLRDKENHTAMFYFANKKQFQFIKEMLKHGAVPEPGMFVIDHTNRSYQTTKTKVDYQHSESLKYVPSEYGGIVRTQVETTGTVKDEEKIPILDYVEKHDKDLYLMLKKVGYK